MDYLMCSSISEVKFIKQSNIDCKEDRMKHFENNWFYKKIRKKKKRRKTRLYEGLG